jgi:site-specific DNA-cytosine methylase
MKMLELFSGSKVMSSTFKEHGWEVFTVDYDQELEPDLAININNLAAEKITELFGHPDVIWSSPPCECFSIANHYRCWTPKRKPRNNKVIDAMRLHQHALEIIKELSPKYYFVENPRGMLRKMPWMKPYQRYTVTYCQYGHTIQKPTDIWTNYPNPQFKKP